MMLRAPSPARLAFRRNTLRAEDFLHLPWLLPSQCLRRGFRTRQRVSSKTASNARQLRKLSSKPAPISRASSRTLATASSPSDFKDVGADAVSSSFPSGWGLSTSSDGQNVSLRGIPSRSNAPSAALPSLKPPLVINSSLAARHQLYRRAPGMETSDLSEIHATLDACLEVYQFDRALLLIRRLSKIYGPDSGELRQLYSIYLESVLRQVVETRDEAHIKRAEACFNMLIRDQKINPDAIMYALMVKLSLQLSHMPKMERSVRRYMQMARENGHDIELLNLPIFSDRDLYTLGQISPADYFDISEPLLDEAEVSLSEALAEVDAVDQKGHGLEALKKSLALFKSANAGRGSQATYDPFERQKRLEADSVGAAIGRWREESEALEKVGVIHALHLPRMGKLMWKWFNDLAPMIRKELEKLSVAEKAPRSDTKDSDVRFYGPFLRLLSPERAAAVTIIQIMHHLSLPSKPNKIANIVSTVGQAIQDEAVAEAVKRNAKTPIVNNEPYALYQKKLAKILSKGLNSSSSIAYLSNRLRHTGLLSRTVDHNWSDRVRFRVGAAVVSMLVKTAYIPVFKEGVLDSGSMDRNSAHSHEPAFKHDFEYSQGRKYGIITLNPELTKKLAQEPAPSALAKHAPMICKPRKWTSLDEGGYLETRTLALRCKVGHLEQLDYAEAATKRGDMDQVYRSLDILGQVPWKINRNVLRVMTEAWNSGKEIANIPAADPQVTYPEEPPANTPINERRKYDQEVKDIDNYKFGLHGQRCFMNYQLETARAYAGEEFFFPHNIDFRGRAYPVPPYLNHMGADNARGLLVFSEAKELGNDGLEWIQIQLANVFGYDKASLSGRRQFTMDHLDDIYDSVDNPLNGRRWWLKAEDPWQCLAACFELKAAMESPDPTKFKSVLPVHQDGSCNGLQHYAALGGDSAGARQVNLEPGDKPSDVYTAVSELVKQSIQQDADNGDKVAAKLVGKITRRVVKQTVMTNVYGVTFLGAMRQVQKQLEVIFESLHKPEDGISNQRMAACIAKKIFEALTSMFEGARKIQFWLAESGQRICDSLTPEQIDWIAAEAEKNGGVVDGPVTSNARRPKGKLNNFTFRSSIIWTTPLQMPVVQPYRAPKMDFVSTHLQRISIRSPQRADPVDKRKQIQAFPPNFIHSLDATHMHLSALKCDEMKLAFAAVHDSFWTHAADVNTLSRVLRDSFVRLHSEDIMGRLVTEFQKRYAGSFYWATIDMDSEAGRQIQAWRRKQGTRKEVKKRIDELFMERKRMKLLGSKDPKAQADAEKMVTPISIIENVAKQSGNDFSKVMEELTGIENLKAKSVQQKPRTAKAVKEKMVVESRDSDALKEGIFEEIQNEAIVDTNMLKGRKLGKLWLPLSFPSVPARGDFDVSRLKASQYFFS